MTPADQPRAHRVVGGVLLVLLVAQGVALASLRDRRAASPAPAACGHALPAADPAHPLDVELQLTRELSAGGSSSGTAVIVNRGRTAFVVLTTQAVLLAPAAPAPAAPPERARHAGVLLEPGQFLRQPLALVARPCPRATVTPGFYEVAVVVVLQPVGGRPVASVSARRAVVVRPAVSGV